MAGLVVIGVLATKAPSQPLLFRQALLEAERATLPKGALIRRHPNASGGAFVEARRSVTLRFSLPAPEPMRVRVIPLFWRNSLRTPPRFFPYPLPTLFGPDAVVALGDRFYFTAPASGRIGIVDANKGKLMGAIELGGSYWTDLVADEKRHRLLAVDAWRGLIFEIDPKTHQATVVASVPKVWSLSVQENRLVAICLLRPPGKGGKGFYTLPAIGKTEGLDIDFVLQPEPVVFRLSDFAPLPADRLDYPFGPRTTAEFGPRDQVGWKRFSLTRDGVSVTVRTEKGDEKRLIPLPAPPTAIAITGNRLLVGTTKGTVVLLDAPSETAVATLQLSDQPIDVAAARGKGYATDPTQNRLVVIDVGKGEIVKSVSVPEEPVALEVYEPRWWTQDEAPRPLLFVACRKGKKVTVVDLELEQVTRTLSLPVPPLSLRLLLPPDPSWWPLIPSDRLAIELTPRLAVLLAPVTKEGEPADKALLPVRRSTAVVKLPDGTEISVAADNNHTLRWALRREGKTVAERWIDTSPVTDTQGAAPVVDCGAVQIADQPFQRGIWMTPDQHLFLVADTDEFWQWNAPILTLRKGRNEISVNLQKFVQLDALRVEPVPSLDLRIVGEPSVPVPEKFRAVFYADEPIRFLVALRRSPTFALRPLPVRLVVRIRNYMGEEVWVRAFELRVADRQEVALQPVLRDTGIFQLTVRAETPEGVAWRRFYFLRLPKLERPRLLARRAQLERARAQLQRYPNLFHRYFAWLREQLSADPHFIPVSLQKSEFTAVLPPEQQKLSERGGWRRYDFAWRLIALQFAAMMLPEPEKQELRQRVLQVLKSGKADGYCHFHHHGPFFPGFVAAFLDLVAAEMGESVEEVQRLREFLATRLGDMNVFAWTLAALNDPPTERERILLWHLMTWTVNAERYFTVHAGKRGGTWWLNQRTGCHCPFGAYAFAFFYLRHFYGEERFHYRTFVRGFLTHARLSRPLNDVRGLLGPPGPPGEPQRWLTFALSRHPLTEAIYGWRDLLKRLDNPEAMNREEWAKTMTFPTGQAHNAPVPFVLPLGLALGWYDPDAPQVSLDELPPTLFFDGEGEVVMRSDYGREATEVFFACGIRDHVYRHQPTNLMVWKAGEPLLGTASLHGDHGCPTLQISRGNSWGNVVVIEPSDWQTRLKHNLFHPRGEENALINRFSDATFRYLVREQRLTGYVPAEGGYGGGLNLHGHTETFLHREGHIIAFTTHPDFDYVAGDATLSWLPEQAELVLRQVVFVRPDLLVVYDRVRLGEKAERAYWLAATGLELRTNGNRFSVQSGRAFLNGFVASPKNPSLLAVDPTTSPKYSPMFDKQALSLKVLEIHPSEQDKGQGTQGKLVEFLVVMRVGLDILPPLSVTPQVTAERMAVTVQANGRTVKVAFNRSDVCGGELVLLKGAQTVRYLLTERINDTYELWRHDPRFKRWQEARFDFLNIR